ncbi:AT-hook motif nuclear-localized protein 17-like [Vicia villosa]|uniref:AT-hook motif nuclear-localized protein 17-like n=1 Tax=Vicia villosa TaxID=3911 RepID=UPI00273C8B03|nr:AT-hook motif nuclear-localized protein 17-like [Vicia villosa]
MDRRPPFSLTQNSSITLGTKRGFIASNTTTITTTNNGGILSQNLRENPIKKPRGRPKGSKNRPKPPVIIKENNETLMESILIEIPPGRDIVEPLIKLALSRQARIIVLSGSGLVSEVSFLHPVTRASGIPLEGVFRMTSFYGTFASANTDRFRPQFTSPNSPNSHFSIFLCGNQGKVFGGVVGGRVIAAGAVLISAALVKNPTFDRLGINATLG